ncbi:MAG: hypothetical protein IJB73_04555 [Firmicutes bacterium]|nr:hypothetical protein [Bacillota bacterium]
MNNKKKKITGLLLLAAVLIVAVYLYMSGQDMSYNTALKANWGITLPYGGEEIYVKEIPEDSFNGDGERYRVFRYDEEPVFDKKLIWSDTTSKEQRLLEIVDNMNPDFEPDLDSGANIFFHMTGDRDERDKLWLIYDEESMMMHVVEDFY